MLGDVLEVAMRTRGLTQAELAEAVGVTQAAISRYISSARVPDPAEIEKLAAAVGVTSGLLTHQFSMRAAIGVTAHMRRQKSTRVSLWKRAEAKLNMYRMHLAMLTARAPLHATNHVPAYDYAFTSPAEAAQHTRTLWQVPLGPVRSMTALLESAGVVIVETDLETPRIDGLSQWSAENPVILLNTSLAPSRRRLTLAHELGHLVLHGDGYVDDDIDVEAQANQFAAEFLMPEIEVRPHLRNASTGKLFDLKREWGVSIQALFERASHFGLVTKEQRTAFYRQLNSRGWRTAEPDEDFIPLERPQLATSLLEQFRLAGLSDADFAQVAGFAEGQIPRELLPAAGLRLV